MRSVWIESLENWVLVVSSEPVFKLVGSILSRAWWEQIWVVGSSGTSDLEGNVTSTLASKSNGSGQLVALVVNVSLWHKVHSVVVILSCELVNVLQHWNSLFACLVEVEVLSDANASVGDIQNSGSLVVVKMRWVHVVVELLDNDWFLNFPAIVDRVLSLVVFRETNSQDVVRVSEPSQSLGFDAVVSWGNLSSSLASWVEHVELFVLGENCNSRTIPVPPKGPRVVSKIVIA